MSPVANGYSDIYVVRTTCQYTLNLRDIYVALTLKGLYKVRAVRRANVLLNEIRNIFFQKANCVLGSMIGAYVAR